MADINRFKQAYETGNLPWDVGKPDSNLIHAVNVAPIKPSKALEVGCGTGDNAIWLAQHGFEVTGIDYSEIAIKMAKQKALNANTSCTFLAGDFLKKRIEGAPFGFAFDRGCFHTVDSDGERKEFAKSVYEHLDNGGLWLSLIGNADEKRDAPGPPQRSAKDIVIAAEPYFEILSLISSSFETNLGYAPRAWVGLMRKRKY